MDKYKHCSIRSNGRPIDSVWLLCGRGEQGQGWSEELGTWALDAGMLPDGLCVFSPFVNELDHAIPAVDAMRALHREAAAAATQDAHAERGWVGAGGAESPEKDAKVDLQDQRMPEPSGRATEEPKPTERTADPAGQAESVERATATNRTTPVDETAEPAAQAAEPAGKVETSAGQTARSKAKPEISYEVVRMLSALAQIPFFKDKLTDARMSQMQFGVSHPICRTRQPDEKDRKRYTRQPVDIAGTEYYLYKDWRPDQLNKLKRTFVKRSS